MTWNELLRVELQRLHAMEGAVVPIFDRMRAKARHEEVRNLFYEMAEAGPSRLGRIETICAIGGWPWVGEYPEVIDGWRRDVNALALRETSDGVTDTMLLTLLLKAMRMRTSCYEVVFLLASQLGESQIANLVSALWADDRGADAETADMLASLVGIGDGDGSPGILSS